MKRLVIFLALFILFCGINVITLASNSSTTQLIDQALKRGEIDSETALVYQTLSVVAPGKLPRAFQQASATSDTCPTGVMLKLAQAWPHLSESAKTTLSPYLITKPRLIPKNVLQRLNNKTYQTTLPNSYQTTNFNIEWGNSTPSMNVWYDFNPANGLPDYIDNLANALETTWTTVINNLQLKAPDYTSAYLLNVYVGDTGNGAPSVGSGNWGYATIFPYDDPLSGMAYFVLSRNFPYALNDDPDGNFLGTMRVAVAHEFFHAVQFAYDLYEAGWMMEMCASWMEDEVFDQVNQYHLRLTGDYGWQMYPEVSLAFANGIHEYGDVIFAKYLSEKYPTVNVMKELWEILDDVSGNNTLSALNTFLGNQAAPSTLTEAFKDFTAKNTTMDYEEGIDYGGYGIGSWMFYQEAISTYPVVNRSYPYFLPDYLGSNYVKFENPDTAKTLLVDFNGNETFNSRSISWGAALVAVKDEGYDVFELSLDSSGVGSGNVPSFGIDCIYSKAFLVCRVLSDTGMSPYPGTPYEYYPNGVPYTFSADLYSITPATVTLLKAQTQQFSVLDGTPPYTWEISDTSVAIVDTNGLVIALDTGTCTVTATDANNVRFVSTITVSFSFLPAVNTIVQGTTHQFSAAGGTETYNWSTSDTLVGTIDTNGLFTSVGPGTCIVIVTDANSISCQSETLTVTKTVISPKNGIFISIGNTRQFTASGGTAPYTWLTSNPSIGTIDTNGLFTAVAEGGCTVTATDANSVSYTTGTIIVEDTSGGGGGGGGGGDGGGSSSSSSSSSSSPKFCAAGAIAGKTPLLGKLNVLRRFRDHILRRSRLGRRFIRRYYQSSPAFVKFLEGKVYLKWLLNKLLLVIIWFLTWVLDSSLLTKYLFWLSFLLLFLSLRQKRKHPSEVRL